MALKDKFLNGRGLYSLMDKIKNFVKPNQQTSGGETNLTSLEVNGTNYKVLPVVTSSDEGKFARVDSNGNWVAVTVPSAENQSF